MRNRTHSSFTHRGFVALYMAEDPELSHTHLGKHVKQDQMNNGVFNNRTCLS